MPCWRTVPGATNIVIFEPPLAWGIEEFVAAAAAEGVLLTPFGGRRIRVMTHLDVDLEQSRQAVPVLPRLARDRSPVPDNGKYEATAAIQRI